MWYSVNGVRNWESVRKVHWNNSIGLQINRNTERKEKRNNEAKCKRSLTADSQGHSEEENDRLEGETQQKNGKQWTRVAQRNYKCQVTIKNTQKINKVSTDKKYIITGNKIN